jgi:hypothetical protein
VSPDPETSDKANVEAASVMVLSFLPLWLTGTSLVRHWYVTVFINRMDKGTARSVPNS